jgi:hypothetical protein
MNSSLYSSNFARLKNCAFFKNQISVSTIKPLTCCDLGPPPPPPLQTRSLSLPLRSHSGVVAATYPVSRIIMFQGLKRPKSKANHPSTSVVQVTDSGDLCPVRLHGVLRRHWRCLTNAESQGHERCFSLFQSTQQSPGWRWFRIHVTFHWLWTPAVYSGCREYESRHKNNDYDRFSAHDKWVQCCHHCMARPQVADGGTACRYGG